MRGKIKRALAGLFVLLLALCLSAGLYVGLKGYGMYREALEQKPLAEMAEQVRAQPDFTPLDELPRLYRDAVVAVEDHRFYSHGGVDFIALCRALWNDVCAGAFVEGGSTITQQLAKNLYFTQEKVLTRKAAEAFMAWAIEKQYTKDEILELYVNSIYFGSGYYNVRQASEGYFGKAPAQMTPYECTLLAGVPNAPSAYDPAQNPGLARQRQKKVVEHSGHADSQIYLAPMDAQPITLFVTGNVPKPGRYSGSAADPLLSYLDKAGGIDAGRGSYRNIQVRRNDQVVTTVDLYPFIREGSMPPIRFQNGDIIVVPDKGPTVTVTGKVRTSARFELPEGNTSGASLLKLVDPDSSASHIAIKGVRNGKPYNTYLPLGELASLQLADGDTIELLADAAGNTITVTVQGAVRGATRFPVRRGARLDEVRNFIAVEQGRADLNGMYIKRKSVAARQKKAIADSLRRLEESALTASSASTEESQIRAKEAEMIAKFVERAKAVEPEGVVVLSDGQKIGDITLEDGDVIVIPAKSDVVLVSGEVMMPQAMLWSKKKDLDDYIKGAGGYNSRADQDTVLVMHPNGSVSHDGDNIRPGDQILVMPRVASKNMQAVKDISQVMMQVAVSARAILGLPTLY